MKKYEIVLSLKFWKRQTTRFLNPDFHGVSANYIANNSILLHSLEEAAFTNFAINKDDLLKSRNICAKILNNLNSAIFPEEWNVEKNLSFYLHAYILKYRPKLVVETGVANGISTNIIMNALEKTGGTLHSFDVRSECQYAYKGIGNWVFHLVPQKNQKRFFKALTRDWNVNLWFHDGDHSYFWQQFEYRLAVQKLDSAGVIISDDIDASEAWIETCKENNLDSINVFDSRKFFGIARKN